jgi:nitroreductase
VLIVAVGIPDQAWVRKDGVSYLQTDIAIVMDHVALAAADLGLGTCWIAAFDAQAVSQVLKLPETVEPLILMTVGYPAHPPKEKMRKPLSELVRYENWEAD